MGRTAYLHLRPLILALEPPACAVCPGAYCAATGSCWHWSPAQDADGDALLAGEAEDRALARAVERWRDRLGEIPSTARLAAWQESGLRLVVPGDAEWPTQLDDLCDTRRLVLWLRGTADLRLTCVNSAAVVGARAATGYGNHVAVEMAAVLAERGVGVVSGGAYATKSQLEIGLPAEKRCAQII